MNKPNLVCGSYNVSPEHPSDWDVPAASAIAKNTSLGGTDLKDTMWRKYTYVLSWEAMSLTDFENLEDLINYHNDSGTPISFVYEKFRQSSTIQLVHADPLTRKRTGGSGKVLYYQNVTLTLVEVNPR